MFQSDCQYSMQPDVRFNRSVSDINQTGQAADSITSPVLQYIARVIFTFEYLLQ